MKAIKLWAACLNLWRDKKGYLHASLAFNHPRIAKQLREELRYGAVDRGRFIATGKDVPTLLEAIGAPSHIVSGAICYTELRSDANWRDFWRRLKAEWSVLSE